MIVDRYQARINLHGTTQRERTLEKTKRDLYVKAQASLSFKEVLINGVEDRLVIDSTNTDTKKSIKSLPSRTFTSGDYVEWADTIWLITSADADKEVYVNGTMEQCNWLLTWQRKDGTIAQYHCVDLNSTQYNSGETGNEHMVLGTTQHMLTLPYNEDTILLDDPQRFYIDRNIENPTCYKVSQNDTVAYNYGNGILKVTVMECEANLEKDRLVELCDGTKVWIADYKDTSASVTKPLVTTQTVKASIYGRNNITIGYARNYSAKFKNEIGDDVDNFEFDWNIECDYKDKIDVTQDKNGCKVVVNDKSLIGKTFKIQVLCNGELMTEKTVCIDDTY